MLKDDWNEFMGSKKRTAASHYSQGRVCVVCGRYITDRNQTGRCEGCKIRKPQGESPEHKRLKEKAVKWLWGQGATKVKLEKGISVGKQRFTADVYGIINGKETVIECGGSQKRKLDKLIYKGVFTIYILPYGHDKPYRLTTGLQVCNRCGNCMSTMSDLEITSKSVV